MLLNIQIQVKHYEIPVEKFGNRENLHIRRIFLKWPVMGQDAGFPEGK